MRRAMLVLAILTAAAALVWLSHTPALAISGKCSNCHTMHNSQSGSAEVQLYEQGGTISTEVGTPQAYLLKANCIGCHAGDTGKQNDFDAPIVLHTTDPGGQGGTHTLAGGDFYWVAEGLGTPDDAKGHNVLGVSDQDANILTNPLTPPGFDENATPGANNDGQMNGGQPIWSTQLTCAGKNGCHGNHTGADASAGIHGAHHSNTGLTVTQASSASTVGSSFRFLSGIKGLENADWNWNENESTHNEYYGENDTGARDQSNTTYTYKDTISYSCAQCHGIFHSQIDDNTLGSPWLRHPTDVVLPDTGEYASYNPGASNLYSIEAPVARPAVPTSSSPTVTPGDDSTDTGAVVMCLSCHRAHGSPEPDLLRWSYDGMKAGNGGAASDTGCFRCHTDKD